HYFLDLLDFIGFFDFDLLVTRCRVHTGCKHKCEADHYCGENGRESSQTVKFHSHLEHFLFSYLITLNHPLHSLSFIYYYTIFKDLLTILYLNYPIAATAGTLRDT